MHWTVFLLQHMQECILNYETFLNTAFESSGLQEHFKWCFEAAHAFLSFS